MIFDVNVEIGRRSDREIREPWSRDDLLVAIRKFGIDKVLVRHAVSREYDPLIGNELLCREIDGCSEFEGIWAIAPHETSSIDEPEVFLQKMKQNNIRSLVIYPLTHKYLFDVHTWSDIFEIAIEYNIPIFLSLKELNSPWSDIRCVLTAFPDLRLILNDLGSWPMERYFYPLLKNFKELYLETSTMRLPMGIKNICDTFGDHRFVFGSGWPVMTPASALTELRYSAISKEARNNIFSGNINRILGEVKL